MLRFLIIFIVLLGLSLALMGGILAQNGYSLFAPEMSMMLIVSVLVAAYVAWRISTILKRREDDRKDRAGDAGKGKLSGLLGGKSKAQLEREARVAARRRKLEAEGKLAPEVPPETAQEAPAAEPEERPTRVASTASVKEKMDARRERVRRAREEGKI